MSSLQTLGRIIAVSEDLTDYAMMNLQKLLEAVVYAAVRVESRNHRRAGDPRGRISEIERLLSELPDEVLPANLRSILDRAVSHYRDRPLGDLTYEAAPDVFVCRNCNNIQLGAAPDSCPGCSAHQGQFRRFQGMFNGDSAEPENPAELIELFDENARAIRSLLSGLIEEKCTLHPFEGRRSVRDHIAHLCDAQRVLIRRVTKILSESEPFLGTEAPYETALDNSGRPVMTDELFTTLDRERAAFVERLRGLSREELWRKGRHEDFGAISAMHQSKYFSRHEQTHIATLGELRRALLAR